MWLIDAFNYAYDQKPSKIEKKLATKKRLEESDKKCACKTFCKYNIDVKALIDDDDDLL